MNWQELFRIPEGQEVPFAPSEIQDLDAVFPITEDIRPCLIMVARLPDGADVMAVLSYHRRKRLYRTGVRIRNKGGDKHVLTSNGWFRVESLPTYQGGFVQRFKDTVATCLGEVTTQITIPASASMAELIDALVASDAFDVVRLDPDEHKARRLRPGEQF